MSAETLEDLRYSLSEGEEQSSADSNAESTFEKFFLTHYRRLFSLLFRITGDRTRAEELANEVLWRAYRQSSPARVDGNLEGWLYRAVTNLGIEDLRANARRQRYERAAAQDLANPGTSTTPLDEVLRAEKRVRVHAVLASLKRWQAQILILRSSGLSYKELADALDFKEASVGTMLARAEAQFQKRYLLLHGNEEW